MCFSSKKKVEKLEIWGKIYLVRIVYAIFSFYIFCNIYIETDGKKFVTST